MLRFTCKSCGQKMKVPDEYAGKKVRCQGCKEPVRVPKPALSSSASSVAAAEVASSPKKSTDLEDLESWDSGSYSLADLAAMEAAAPASPAQYSHGDLSEGSKACPSCGKGCSENASLCVQCGHSFDSGEQHQTTRDKKPSKMYTTPAGIGMIAFIAAAAISGIVAVAWIVLSMLNS